MTPEEIAEAIGHLTISEYNQLIALLNDEPPPGTGVREPRTPLPDPGGALAQALPEDYWETAE